MKVIDVQNWNRKTQYENFIKYTNPTFSLGTRLDVTNLVDYVKRTKKSFFSCFLYVLSKAVNSVEEMRTRLIDGKPVLFDVVNPSFIVMRDDEVIVTCLTKYTSNFNEFYSINRKNIEEKKNSAYSGPFESHGGIDCLYISCLPWVDIRSMSNPYNFDDESQTSIPRITWGKYVLNGFNRYEMGLDICVHHALIDGYQVSKVFTLINEMLNDIDKILGE